MIRAGYAHRIPGRLCAPASSHSVFEHALDSLAHRMGPVEHALDSLAHRMGPVSHILLVHLCLYGQLHLLLLFEHLLLKLSLRRPRLQQPSDIHGELRRFNRR